MLSQLEKRYRSTMEKSMSGFIWAVDKETLNDNFWTEFSSCFSLDPLLTLLITIPWQSIFRRPHCNSWFLFIKELLLFISSVLKAISLISTWKKDNEMSHNETSVRDNCAVCHVLCLVLWGQRSQWKKCRWHVEANSSTVIAPFPSTREPSLHTL